VERELAGETEVLGENLPQWYFVHQKSHMTWPELEPGPLRSEAVTNSLEILLHIQEVAVKHLELRHWVEQVNISLCFMNQHATKNVEIYLHAFLTW
jgi:hypothetical protein